MGLNQERILQELSKSMIELDMDAVKAYTEKALHAGVSPRTIIKKGLSTGMEDVGNKFASGRYFLSELIWAGQIMKEATAIIEPYLEEGGAVSAGRVVIASVEGDLHDIGKNIAISMLKSAGFEVVDLGVDVPAERIVEKAKETDADIVALSALLSVVVPNVEKTVKAVRESSIGNKVKILLGGRVVDAEKAKRMRADAYARDAWDGIAKAKELMSSIAI